MKLNLDRARACLKVFDFTRLFVEELGWARCKISPFEIRTDDHVARLNAIAEQGGMVVYEAQPVEGPKILPSHIRKAVDRQVTKRTFEHVIIFTNTDRTQSVWLWVKREQGKPKAPREHQFFATQVGDALLQKLDGLFFDLDDLDDEGQVPIIIVSQRAAHAFDIEKITKRFYEFFKTEHERFLKFIKGIENMDQRRWYASVMLNRLMFIYFIQKKGFLDGDQHYLANRLEASKENGKDQFYDKVLTRLFFEGFALEPKERPESVSKLLGNIPYLNGGLFLEHEIEKKNRGIAIPDAAFEKLFGFFNNYQWHLDDRPYRTDKEINPDVLGYIFEKYINQKQMGAYYSKEDITDYICKNTIIPFLFDKLAAKHPKAVTPLPVVDIEPYIYQAVKTKDRLPTETEREYTTRQKRLAQIRADFKGGKITGINDFITYNLDITAYAQDFIRNLKDPAVLRTFYFECLKPLSVLDPTCGSGAFLFAALNILETLYELCLDKLEEFNEETKCREFAEELGRVEQHPNRRYFIYKSIIIGNLYGVDIMEEATEICKLRLFLKLASEIDPDPEKENYGVEPLPDIDFNIRAGNTLVGYANLAEVKNSMFGRTVLDSIKEVDAKIKSFRATQTERGVSPTIIRKNKEIIYTLLDQIDGELDHSLYDEYGGKNFNQWRASHQPFHWYVEFNNVFQNGGFDVIVGNPPYVEYSKVRREYQVRGCKTESAGNLYAYVTERSLSLLSNTGSFGFIVPISLVCTQRMQTVQTALTEKAQSLWLSNYAERPSKLFVGAEVLLSIVLARTGSGNDSQSYTTGFTKWTSEEREHLFHTIAYLPIRTKIKPYVFQKLSVDCEYNILEKVAEQRGRLGMSFRRHTEYPVYYRIGGGRYWKIFTNYQPRFVLNGKQSISSRENYLYLESSNLRDITIAVLSSSLFYWYFVLTTNCRDLNPSDLVEFPINLARVTPQHATSLVDLCKRLMKDYQTKSESKCKTSELTGDIQYQEFYPRKSKALLDEIDRVLAKHYGFTAEELDFIINYDIKYRMGQNEEGE